MHDHHHGHHHHHNHGKKEDPAEQKNVALAFFLNLGFAIVELIGGYFTGSVAILSSAIHDLGDSISLGLAYLMVKKSFQEKDKNFSYGFRRYSLLSAVVTGVVLVVGSLFVFWEAVPRLLDPQLPNADGMLLFAVMGLAVNGYMAYRVSHGESINEQVISLHFLEDMMGWAMVLIIALVLQFVDWPILDPLLSIAYTSYILYGVVRMLLKTAKIFLQAAPDCMSIDEVEKKILAVKGVKGVYDTKFWSLDGQKHVLTTCVKVDDTAPLADCEQVKEDIRAMLESVGKIITTIEVEAESSVRREEDDDDGIQIQGCAHHHHHFGHSHTPKAKAQDAGAQDARAQDARATEPVPK